MKVLMMKKSGAPAESFGRVQSEPAVRFPATGGAVQAIAIRGGSAAGGLAGGQLTHAVTGNLAHAVAVMQAVGEPVLVQRETTQTRPGLRVVITPETAFYRKYMEGMLRRYGVMKLQKGRVPSLLGRELFRGKVTSYKVHGFDDVVIFVHDVEQCLKLLDAEQQGLVYRVAVQEYTFGEAAAMLKWSLRSTKRRYNEAVDELTAIFQKRGLMEKVPGLKNRNSCQEGEEVGMAVSYSPAMTSA